MEDQAPYRAGSELATLKTEMVHYRRALKQVRDRIVELDAKLPSQLLIPFAAIIAFADEVLDRPSSDVEAAADALDRDRRVRVVELERDEWRYRCTLLQDQLKTAATLRATARRPQPRRRGILGQVIDWILGES